MSLARILRAIPAATLARLRARRMASDLVTIDRLRAEAADPRGVKTIP